MARPQRRDPEREPVPFPPVGGYRTGGEVGRMQADLAQRLSLREDAGTIVVQDVRPGQRAMRFVSVAGGYLALGAAYAGVVVLVLLVLH